METGHWLRRDKRPFASASRGDKVYGEMVVTTDGKAVHPPRPPICRDREFAGSFQQRRQDDSGFRSCERCADTLVDASSECEMASSGVPRWSIENEFVGTFILLRIAIGRAPEQQNVRARRNLDAAKRRVVRRGPMVEAERRFQPQDLLDEGGNLAGRFTQSLLDVRLFREDTDRIAQQARRRLSPR